MSYDERFVPRLPPQPPSDGLRLALACCGLMGVCGFLFACFGFSAGLFAPIGYLTTAVLSLGLFALGLLVGTTDARSRLPHRTFDREHPGRAGPGTGPRDP